MSVVSLRLQERDLKRIEELAAQEHKDNSTVARELLEQGWEYRMVMRYKEGRPSISSLAEKLECSLGEAIDLPVEFNVEAPIDYDSNLQSFEGIRPRNR